MVTMLGFLLNKVDKLAVRKSYLPKTQRIVNIRLGGQKHNVPLCQCVDG